MNTWNKDEQLKALKELRASTEALISYVEAQDGEQQIPENAMWRFPYAPEAKFQADKWRNDYSRALISTLSPTQYLCEFNLGNHEWAALSAFYALGLAELLPKPGRKGVSAEQLAAKSGASLPRLRTVLRSMSRVHLVSEVGHPLSDEWVGSEHVDLMRKDSPSRFGSMVEYCMDDAAKCVNTLPALVKKENANNSGTFLVFGHQDLFSWYATEESGYRSSRFNQAMQSLNGILSGGPTEDYPWDQVTGLAVDVAGGVGGQTIPLVARHSHLKVQIQDLKEVSEDAKKLWATMPPAWADRVEIREHDFNEPQPDEVAKEAQVYFMRFILHDWSDAKAIEILKNLRKKARPDAKLLILEVVLFGMDPRYAQILAVHLMAVAGSNERTEAEYAALLNAGGWKLEKTYRTRSVMSVIEASPA